jgi:hypothetical protein
MKKWNAKQWTIIILVVIPLCAMVGGVGLAMLVYFGVVAVGSVIQIVSGIADGYIPVDALIALGVIVMMICGVVYEKIKTPPRGNDIRPFRVCSCGKMPPANPAVFLCPMFGQNRTS